MIKHLDIQIFGRVQGVAFRYYSKERADSLEIKGLARNLADGSVIIEAEGEEKALEEFVTWCRKGPLFAKVEKISVREAMVKNYSKFTNY